MPVVLVVDDDADLRDAARTLLEDEGFTVDCAAEGGEALARLRTSPLPALVLVDLRMPGMDGTTLLREIESDAALAGIPIVVLTAWSPSPETSGLRYPLLRKPFEFDALLDIVTTYVSRPWDTDGRSVSKGLRALHLTSSASRTTRD